MPRVERSGTRVTLATTLFNEAEIMLKVGETAPYPTFLMQVTIVPMKVLPLQGDFHPADGRKLLKKLCENGYTSSWEGNAGSRINTVPFSSLCRHLPVDPLSACYCILLLLVC